MREVIAIKKPLRYNRNGGGLNLLVQKGGERMTLTITFCFTDSAFVQTVSGCLSALFSCGSFVVSILMYRKMR